MTSDIFNMLGEQFCKGNGIDNNSQYTIEIIDATKLIVPNRIDIIAKLLYVWNFVNNVNSSFITELYDAHISAFTHGTCAEPGNEKKNSINDYHSSFNELIHDIQKNGFDDKKSIIPVGADYGILDGAHRVACSIYFHQKVKIVRFPTLSLNFGYEYFKHEFLDDIYLDYLLLIYSFLKPNVYVANIWPVALNQSKREQTFSLIEKHGKLIAKKNVQLSYLGYRNYMLQIYCKHEWVGSFKDHFKGVMSKVDSCYCLDKPLAFCFFEAECLDSVLELKEEIRTLFGIGNHSVHISDNQEESIQMLEILLNRNSLNLINHCRPDTFNCIEKFITQEMNCIKANRFFEQANRIYAGDISLALYGIKNRNSFKEIRIGQVKSVDNFTNLPTRYLNDLVIDPRKYCVFFGIKFLSLEELRLLKDNRNSSEDVLEIKLIDNCIENFSNIPVPNIYQIIKRKINLKIRSIMGVGIVLSRKLHIYDLVRSVYRGLKGR